MPQYKRIILKLSGEALADIDGVGISKNTLDDLAEQIAYLHQQGIEIGIVIGGGNILRGAEAEKLGIDRATGDYMGMLATIINALALQNALLRRDIDARVMSSFTIPEVAEPYILAKALSHFSKRRVIIFGGGTGLPFFSTDTTAALRALELKAEAIFKATKVDAVYSDDPMKNEKAVRYETITYTEFLLKNLKVMDATAVSLCRDFKLPIVLFSIKGKDTLIKAVIDGKVGTVIKEG
ncbi:UMP kinase [Caldisericum exile]|uniref:Uridylate kinase n=1 Tax=Caldisericum exile (strain DSM 21853 / NBRC 104410 / AZM16c01) TaxID=511051 RepID=A0A7U6GEI8_CALEA|nr:UMP kinase [Caldisericum exile]BAL80933.1 uridylate kinase [Caldisericum exile AZM16c01]